MNGSERLRERVNGGLYSMLEFGANDHAEVFLLAADLGDALRALFDPSSQPHGAYCSCGACGNAHHILARLDAWGQE